MELSCERCNSDFRGRRSSLLENLTYRRGWGCYSIPNPEDSQAAGVLGIPCDCLALGEAEKRS